MQVTYIYNSGFLVELDKHILLFDYYQGTIPPLNQNKPLYVFVSHFHHDHYNPAIYQINHPKITYIIDRKINNKYQVGTFKKEISKIKDIHFDLMMIPLDPRLEESSWWGMEHILKNIKTKYVLPMHFTDNPKMMLKYLNHEPLKQYNNILKINNEGEIFIIGDNNDD